MQGTDHQQAHAFMVRVLWGHVGGAKDFVFFTANFDPHILAGQSVLYCLPHMAHGAHMPAKDLRASCPEADGVTCVRPSQDGFRVGFNFSRRAE
jgi:hypothetical protein